MSLLMFKVDPDRDALIVTDTLVTDTFGNPCRYATKCRLFPHMNMAMAATGSGNLLDAWAQRLTENMLAIDVDMAAQHSPPALRELWAQICEQHDVEPLVGPNDPTVPAGASAGRTATIYQFGQRRDGRFVWYVFRSYADFEAERWDQGGFGVKPHPDGGFGPDAVAPETVDEMVDMSIRIRTEQDTPAHRTTASTSVASSG